MVSPLFLSANKWWLIHDGAHNILIAIDASFSSWGWFTQLLERKDWTEVAPINVQVFPLLAPQTKTDAGFTYVPFWLLCVALSSRFVSHLQYEYDDEIFK